MTDRGSLDDDLFDLYDEYSAASAANYPAAASAIAEYILDEAYYVTFSNPATLWATTPDVGLTVRGVQILIPPLKAFRDLG